MSQWHRSGTTGRRSARWHRPGRDEQDIRAPLNDDYDTVQRDRPARHDDPVDAISGADDWDRPASVHHRIVRFTKYYFVEYHERYVDRNVGRTDRLARIGAGTALLGAGAKHGLTSPARGALEAGVGSVLVATGVSGRCPAYGLVDIDTAE